jgi:hypothetical protein
MRKMHDRVCAKRAEIVTKKKKQQEREREMEQYLGHGQFSMSQKIDVDTSCEAESLLDCISVLNLMRLSPSMLEVRETNGGFGGA